MTISRWWAADCMPERPDGMNHVQMSSLFTQVDNRNCQTLLTGRCSGTLDHQAWGVCTWQHLLRAPQRHHRRRGPTAARAGPWRPPRTPAAGSEPPAQGLHCRRRRPLWLLRGHERRRCPHRPPQGARLCWQTARRCRHARARRHRPIAPRESSGTFCVAEHVDCLRHPMRQPLQPALETFW